MGECMQTVKLTFLGTHTLGNTILETEDSRQGGTVVNVPIRLRKYERGIKSHLRKKRTAKCWNWK
jgi:hypothetical protein